MSATIPNEMKMKELLKSTGYDCPDNMQGKTFTEATSGGGGGPSKTEVEKSVSYTSNGTYEVTPDKPTKQSLSKVTVEVAIPSDAKEEVEVQEKYVNNGAYDINPPSGKVLKSVFVEVDVPSPSTKWYAYLNPTKKATVYLPESTITASTVYKGLYFKTDDDFGSYMTYGTLTSGLGAVTVAMKTKNTFTVTGGSYAGDFTRWSQFDFDPASN